MSACPIRKLEVESLLKKTNIVDGRRIINRPLFNKLNEDVKKDHKDKFGLKRDDLPYLIDTNKDKNPNSTRETRLSNNRYSETYTVNEPYYEELQRLADAKADFDLFAEDRERLYEDDLGQDPSLDDARALEDFKYLLNKPEDEGGITQFCSR